MTGSAKKALQSLHQQLGVRRENLRMYLGRELRDFWQITADDDSARVLAKTIIRVEQVIVDCRDENLIRVARVFYNIPPDPQTRELRNGPRLRVLHQELGPRYAPRSIDRLMKPVVEDVLARLCRPCLPIPPQEVIEAVALEQSVRSPAEGSRLRLAMRNLLHPRPPADTAVEAFLNEVVYGHRFPDGKLAVVRTGHQGDWICVFSSLAMLHAYPRVVHPSCRKDRFRSGKDLLQEVTGHTPHPGVLIDPRVEPDADLTGTLCVSPSLINKIMNDLRNRN